MISDTLFDAGEDIREYLANPVFAPMYRDEKCQSMISALLRHMRYVQWFLDSGDETDDPRVALSYAFAMGTKAIGFMETGAADDAWIAATAAAHWGRMAIAAMSITEEVR